MARRDHPLRSSCTRRAHVHLADIRAIAGLADDLTTGTLDLTVDGRLRRASSRARLDGRGRARRRCDRVDRARRPLAGAGSRWPLDGRSDSCVRHIGGGRSAEPRTRTTWPALDRRLAPPLDGVVELARSRSRTSTPWSAERPRLYDLRVTAAVAGRRGRRGGHASGSASGASRSAAWTCSSTAQRVLLRGVNRHDFDQHTGRVDLARVDARRPRAR